jgi:hypothetical protein
VRLVGQAGQVGRLSLAQLVWHHQPVLANLPAHPFLISVW